MGAATGIRSKAVQGIRRLQTTSGKRAAPSLQNHRPTPFYEPQQRSNGLSRSNWHTLDTQRFSKQSLDDLFRNKIPDLKFPGFLSAGECGSLVDIIKTHEIGAYGANVFPPIGSVGVTQFGNQQDKDGYFGQVDEAMGLQRRFCQEAGIDVVERFRQALQETTGMRARIAQEGDRRYFAGLIRLINKSALLHADFGPFDGPSWEIGRISSQLTWNILLKQVEGGEGIVYDRFWQGGTDDQLYKDPPPGYGYSHSAVKGVASKSMSYTAGDVHMFNPRNFHEVRALPAGAGESRYTMTSFVGLLPGVGSRESELILWS